MGWIFGFFLLLLVLVVCWQIIAAIFTIYIQLWYITIPATIIGILVAFGVAWVVPLLMFIGVVLKWGLVIIFAYISIALPFCIMYKLFEQ